ncbi:unnamed protein product [Spodoptera exigua]|nr:unnamed protein product [Spodoptera exigua]
MSEERDLIKKRGSFKGRLTAFVTFLDSLKDKVLSSCDVSELQLRMGKMESLYEQYDEVQLRLECIADDIKVHNSERTEFESLYYKALSRAQTTLNDSNKEDKSMESCRSTLASIHKPVKLPTIQLPKFSGSYCNWLEFRDTFTSLIHSNDEIDEVNKFHYLRASLEGPAAVIIKSIEFSSSNYSVAWSLLLDRFDNKRLLAQNHVSALYHIDAVTKESSVALKGLIDQLNKDLRALESLGEPVKHWDTFLIYHVTQKIDHRTYREWEEFKGRIDKESSITFDMFMQFLRTRADLIENLERLQTNNNNSQTAGRSNPKIKSMLVNQPHNSPSIETAPKVCPKCNTDPKFYEPADVDLLIGADLFWKLLGSQKLELGNGKPILYKTHLGWIVSGPILTNDLKCNFCKDVSHDHKYVSSFDLPEQRLCEKEPSILGDSFKKATHCCLSLVSRDLPASIDVDIAPHEPDKLLGVGRYPASDDLGFPKIPSESLARHRNHTGQEGRNLAKTCTHKCVPCRRMKGRVVSPILGNLPRERLRPGYPFESTGVGYAEPIIAFVIAYTSDFIPRMVYKYVYSPDNTLAGYIDHSLSLFNTSDYQEDWGADENEVDPPVCAYRGYRNPPDHADPYGLSPHYWHVFAARLAFVVVFEHVVFGLTGLMQLFIPDVPSELRTQMQREALLAKEAKYEHGRRRLSTEYRQLLTQKSESGPEKPTGGAWLRRASRASDVLDAHISVSQRPTSPRIVH